MLLERSFVMLPYDGSPGGNALGLMIDDENRRINDEMLEENMEQISASPQALLQLVASLTAATIVLFVMLYGTVG